MITIDDNNGSTITPEMMYKTRSIVTPCTDNDVESILSDAERSAQSELRSTSEILKLAGCVLRDRASGSASSLRGGGSVAPILMSPLTLSPPPPSPTAAGIVLRDHAAGTSNSSGNRNGISSVASISIPPLSIKPSLSSSPVPSPTSYSPTLDDSIHLPGKLASLSSAEVKKKLTSSPIKRTELLSKLDGLDRVIPSNSSMLSNSSSADSSDELANKVAISSSAVSAAMENAHAHANRIKKNKLNKNTVPQRPRAISIGNSPSFSTSPANLTLSLSAMAIDQSVHTQSPNKKSYSEKMPLRLWVQRKIDAESGRNITQDADEYFSQYEIHPSETIISHVFNRGNWTWTTEWSPDGKYLALATENHGLSIVEAEKSTPIWKVIHDEHIGKLKNDTTHTIRSIAWGGTFIALGGTGDAVSIVEPCLSSGNCGKKQYSFDVVDVITETGFVGALCWLKNSNILAIGNREDQCLIAEIRRGEDGTVTSNILDNIERSDWVTAVKFSHGGTKLAVGDRSGLLSVYLFVMIRPGEAPALSPLQDFQMEDAILDIQWSPDGKFLYTGGEDYSITILDTAKYSMVHRIGRDRWVTFVAPSRGGSHLAVGGGCSEVSFLDVNKKWEDVTCLPSEGGIPLSASWHPKDEYLSICGQLNDVVVYKSSCQRLPLGRCLRSQSSILALAFSPDGKIIAVGNETGLVTFFDVETNPNEVPETLYETVIGIGGDMAIKWTANGKYVAITSGPTFVLLDTSYTGKLGTNPRSSARFRVRKVVQSGLNFTSLSVCPNNQFIALADDQTRILDLKNNCSCMRVIDQSNAAERSLVVSSSWNEDGSLFAMVGGRSNLAIYDSRSSSPDNWELLFSISLKATISSLCWGPSVKKGLQYLAFGGGNETVAILEIKAHEQTLWETVLQIPCNANINDLVWNNKGLLCIGDDDGTVSVVDLSYLKSGKAVSEMNYNWQRQGVISQTKLTRNLGRNAITSLCCRSPSAAFNFNTLAVGGSDGIFEIIDLSERGQLQAAPK